MARKRKAKVTDEMRKNERSTHPLSRVGETTDEQAAKRRRILADTFPPSCQWPLASSWAPHVVWPAYPRPVGPLASAAIRYPYLYLLTEGDGYHFSDYSTLHARILAYPPPIMTSDGAASTQAPRLTGLPRPVAAAPGPVGPPAVAATCYPFLFAGGARHRRSTDSEVRQGAASTLPAYEWSSAPRPRSMGPSAPRPRSMGPPAPRLMGPQAAYGQSSAPCPMVPPALSPRPMTPWAASAPGPAPWAPPAFRPRPIGPPASRPMGSPDERVDEDEFELELRL